MNKGIFFASLNSNRLKEFANNKIDNKNEIQTADIFVFDVHETLNGIFFQSTNLLEQKQKIDNTIELIESAFINYNQTEKIIRYSQVKKKLKIYLKELYNEYYDNAKFESHCNNQIFKNLQPKLRALEINNNKSNYIEILVPFLISEIAMYLFVYDNEIYSKIYGLESEMEIVTAIKNKKYAAFEKFLKNPVPHHKIEI